VPGFEDVVLRPTSFADAELHEPRAAWVSADYAHAASTLASHALLDRAVLYLHRAATLSSTGLGHWLSFGRALVALASAEPPYPVAEDDVRMRQLAADALGNAARGFLTQCPPTSAIELAECTKTRTLARDVLAQLVVHCDNADGALWDRCPEEFLSPLRTANLPEWPGPPTVTASRAQDPPCDVARRSWPELTREAFEREYNGPGLPVIVGNLTEGWPAKAWTDATANEHWLYLRTAQSVVRSLMRRTRDLPPGGHAGSIFGVGQLRGKLDNQYIHLDDPHLAYRHPLVAGYARPELVQPSLLETQQCFPQHLDMTDAKAQRDAFHIHSRWLLVSAADSGSGWHIDPWNTSAWNALLHGRKRWGLYPPTVSGLPSGAAGASPKEFFGTVLDKLSPAERPLQCVLEEGETIFLPSGWWHSACSRELLEDGLSPRDISRSIWSHRDLSGAIWSHRDLSRSIWIYLDLSGSIWSHLDLSGVIWSGRGSGRALLLATA